LRTLFEIQKKFFLAHPSHQEAELIIAERNSKIFFLLLLSLGQSNCTLSMMTTSVVLLLRATDSDKSLLLAGSNVGFYVLK